MSPTELGTPAATRARRPLRRGVLIRYRVLAYTTAILLLVLCFVAVPLQVWGDRPTMAMVVGQIHGYLYMVYLVVAFEISVKLRVRLTTTILILLAGTVPFGAVFAERHLTRRWHGVDRRHREPPEPTTAAPGPPG